MGYAALQLGMLSVDPAKHVLAAAAIGISHMSRLQKTRGKRPGVLILTRHLKQFGAEYFGSDPRFRGYPTSRQDLESVGEQPNFFKLTSSSNWIHESLLRHCRKVSSAFLP